MNQQSLPQVEAFRNRIHQFDGLWRSLVIRAAWASVNSVDMVLFLHASLETVEPDKLVRPRHDPKIQDFYTLWEVRPATDIDAVLDDLKRDVLQVGGRTLRIGLFDGTPGKEQFNSSSLSYWYEFAKRREDARLTASSCPRASLRMQLREIDQATAYLVKLDVLKERWNALSKPFDDLNDVLMEFLGVERSPGADDTSAFVRVEAQIPIMFDKSVGFDSGKLIVEINAPATATLKDVALGRVVRRCDGEKKRTETHPNVGAWRKPGDRRLYRLVESARGVEGFSAYLKYRNVILDERKVAHPTLDRENPALIMHERFDPDFEYLYAALDGKIKHENCFEHAVGWLLGFCGLAPITYGTVKGLKKGEVDHFVYVPQHKTFVGLECTAEQPNIKDKLSKLYQRCEEVRARVAHHEIVAAIASRLALNEIPPTEQQIAAQNEVALLTIDKLRELLNMARERRSTSEVLDFIVDCIPIDGTTTNSLLGNIKRSLRKRYSK